MPSAVLKAIVSADTAAAQAKLAAVGKQVNTLGTTGTGALSKFSTGAKVAFTLAGAAAVAFGVSAVKSYREHQVAVSQLQNAIKNSPQLIGATTAEFEKQATAMQNLTGFQDEEILKADAVLARFQLTATEIKKLNPLILDFARATGRDATSSAELLGKALLGNARALKTVGINFKPTGDRAKDLASIMGILEEKVGGAAAAFGRTDAGKVAILGARYDDLKESVGKLISDALVPIVSVVGKAADAFNAIPGPMKTVLVGAVGLTAAMVALGIAVNAVKGSLAGLGLQAGGLAKIMGPLAPILVGLGVGLAVYNANTKAAARETQALEQGIKGLTLEQLRSQLTLVEAAMARGGRGGADLASIMRALRNRIAALENKAGGARRAVDGFRNSMEEGTRAGADGLSVLGQVAGAFGTVAGQARTATSQVAAYLNNMRALAETRVPVFGQPQRRQHGGPASGLTWVGEAGPELLNLPSRSYVHSNPESRRMTAGAGPTVIFQGPVYGLPDFEHRIEQALQTMMQRWMPR
jgi:hypothetical protein